MFIWLSSNIRQFVIIFIPRYTLYPHVSKYPGNYEFICFKARVGVTANVVQVIIFPIGGEIFEMYNNKLLYYTSYYLYDY